MNDLEKLIRDLTVEADAVTRDVRQVVSKGALNIKNDWRQRASGIEHAPRYSNSIGYDMQGNTYLSRAVIGPEDTAENQGFLGAVLEFGGAHNAPRNDGAQALDAETPRFAKAISDVAGKRL